MNEQDKKEFYELGVETKKGFIMCYNESHMDLPMMKIIHSERSRWEGGAWKIRKTTQIIKTEVQFI